MHVLCVNENENDVGLIFQCAEKLYLKVKIGDIPIMQLYM